MKETYAIDVLIDLGLRPSWQQHAACRGVGTEAFFQKERGGRNQYDRGRTYCQSCPVQAECAEYGETQLFGLWGGISPKQRAAKRAGRPYELAGILPPAACGTPSGYNRHVRRGDKPCEPCREAKVADVNRRRAAARREGAA